MNVASRELGDSAANIDSDFIGRAIDEADLNALRIALYQATGDPELAQMRVEASAAHGGATNLLMLAPEDRAKLRKKAIEYLSGAPRPAQAPDDAELRRLMEMMLGRSVTDHEFDFHRTAIAFDRFPHGAIWHGPKPAMPEGFRVAVVGAGISGIATAIQLGELGIPYVVLERRHEVGGTWSINAYPDVRVDTTNFMYQYSFEKNHPWSEYFCRAPEVRNYIEIVAKKHGVFENIRFGHDVVDARFGEEESRWTITVVHDGAEETLKANVVIAASGLFSVPRLPDFAGLTDFTGTVVHTAQWHGDIDVRGKRVGIIGNGSTGVQLLSSVAAQAANVTVFQRTPQWISPRERYGEKVSPEMRWLLDTMPYFWNWNMYSMTMMGLTHQPLQEYDRAWQAQGGKISQANDHYRDSLTHYIESKLGDRRDLIEKVTPAHAPMARRLIVDNGWYTALLRDNVELVTDPIERLTPTGIRTADGRDHVIDLVIAATGFQATKYVAPARYHGIGGLELTEKWESEGTPRAYLGVSVPGFPNLFIHYGPNSQPRGGSLTSFQEMWARYSVQLIANMLESGHRSVQVKPEVYDRYNQELDAASENIIWGEPTALQRNYYVDKNGRSSVNAPWRIEDYFHLLAEPTLDDYLVN